VLEVSLKPGREKSVLRGHPWIFSGSVTNIPGDFAVDFPGQTIRVLDSQGKFLAWGAINPHSKILIRVWSLLEEERIESEFFHQRIQYAVDQRVKLNLSQNTNAFRLINAESDGLPGLIVDQYDQTLVLQFLTGGVEYWRETILEQLREVTSCEQIFERSDTDIRKLEGLHPRSGLLIGDEITDRIEIFEGDRRYLVDVAHGQKTGFFLDQRDNRTIVQSLSSGKSVLDCFAYTGGFTIAGVNGGAMRVTALESSNSAIQMGKEIVDLNNIPGEQVSWLEADVFKQLRRFRDSNQRFDLIILDPPKFAPTAAHSQKAARGYKDINLLAFKLLNPGGQLATFSCSGGVSQDLFQKIVASAALDAGVDGKIIRKLGPGVDHPVALNFPEGSYLKGLVVQL
jgi:23S rRNA (cytosine1962-C5)-methyltransferase